MKNLLKRINEEAAVYAYVQWYERQPTQYNKIDLFFMALYFEIKSQILYWYCTKTDHKWVDESYGGPESGAIDMYCERCGHSIHHQLY